mmetsp:Transcript_17545/g.37939  ORF Transcript_17545/g.37939 Transcript_17545/m.37939 type:complete len:520 (+) Transcript_17545:2170-3729(+)
MLIVDGGRSVGRRMRIAEGILKRILEAVPHFGVVCHSVMGVVLSDIAPRLLQRVMMMAGMTTQMAVGRIRGMMARVMMARVCGLVVMVVRNRWLRRRVGGDPVVIHAVHHGSVVTDAVIGGGVRTAARTAAPLIPLPVITVFPVLPMFSLLPLLRVPVGGIVQRSRHRAGEIDRLSVFPPASAVLLAAVADFLEIRGGKIFVGGVLAGLEAEAPLAVQQVETERVLIQEVPARIVELAHREVRRNRRSASRVSKDVARARRAAGGGAAAPRDHGYGGMRVGGSAGRVGGRDRALVDRPEAKGAQPPEGGGGSHDLIERRRHGEAQGSVVRGRGRGAPLRFAIVQRLSVRPPAIVVPCIRAFIRLYRQRRLLGRGGAAIPLILSRRRPGAACHGRAVLAVVVRVPLLVSLFSIIAPPPPPVVRIVVIVGKGVLVVAFRGQGTRGSPRGHLRSRGFVGVAGFAVLGHHISRACIFLTIYSVVRLRMNMIRDENTMQFNGIYGHVVGPSSGGQSAGSINCDS